jgi:hypothetical protein
MINREIQLAAMKIFPCRQSRLAASVSAKRTQLSGHCFKALLQPASHSVVLGYDQVSFSKIGIIWANGGRLAKQTRGLSRITRQGVSIVPDSVA